MKIRQATPADADELVRLRATMLRTVSAQNWDDDWREPARASLARRLGAAEPTLAAFVADRPDGPGLAACVVGLVEERLGGPGNPGGRVGYVFSVSTDPDMRRRGYSRACMEALLRWFRDQGVPIVDLRASPSGEPLYTSLGFVRTSDPAMRLRL
ncbi:GNAT family N-acetyltransferase [Actinoplanes derwentensis]|uniref:Acetyltransferase (GNAT) family protein n=1 Tax=Actinoplanes derwentensis TaxID=113562 RepID=A0A1H2D9U1_9ACTN|nr:GNAT family N-acetyltransferase [Actinoplanes derwentensis]GID81575.1 N-acetyltransferase [Actinoplanes derwentensis]SDT79347.1 Acetyltransferase (GNAT) family protein [Actinoplanes derwentensis]